VGREDATHYNLANESYQKKALNGHWLTRMKEKGLRGGAWSHYWQAAKGYIEGFGHASGIATNNWMLLPTSKTVAVVISVMNEEATVMNVLNELQRLPLDEIVVVVNGSRDATFQKVRGGSKALIVYYPEPLGYDVGRVIGSRLTSSDIIIYVDGDVPVDAEQLLPFIAAIDQGSDVALNHITPFLHLFSDWDGVSIVKQFMNKAMGRSDLGANSLTAVPHALSRKALETIGIEHLMVPPQAQMLAIAKGLVVSAPWSVDVITTNRVNKRNAGIRNSVSDMIIGDHIEALHAAQELGGARLAFPDLIRKRSYLA
jgi:PII-like signaling protein